MVSADWIMAMKVSAGRKYKTWTIQLKVDAALSWKEGCMV